jgi:glycosyltransferase involved in cell wall biosynthesis
MVSCAIESTVLVSPPFSGLARCTKELVNALAQLNRGNGELQLHLLYQLKRLKNWRLLPRGPSIKCSPWVDWLPFGNRSYDVLLATSYLAPRNLRAPLAIQVHDLYPQLGYNFLDEASRLRWGARMQKQIERADAVICVSEATRRDLLAHTSYQTEKTFVVHHGVSKRFFPASLQKIEAVRRRHSLDRPFLLFAGLPFEQKNLCRLIRAYALWPRSREFDLAIAGPIYRRLESTVRLQYELQRSGISSRTRLLGYVEDEDLPVLYSAASAFLFASTYEGFGLPILEAMRCGAPVLTSTAGACPEVARGHAVLVDAYDIDSIVQGLENVVYKDPEKIAAAQSYAESMTWDKAAERMRGVLKTISRA